MLPSSSRVRLNQAIRLEPLSRRRRASELTASVAAEPSQQATEAGCVQDGSKARQRLLTEQVGPEKVTHTASNVPQDSWVDPHTRKRRKRYESRRDFKEEAPCATDNRSSHTNLGGSQGTLRRAVGASRCSFCGDCKCVLPQQRASGKRGQKSISPGLDQSAADSKTGTEKQFTKASKKNVIWRNSRPKLTLCDVAQYCDACSHKCGFLLTDTLKTKVVHCFKLDMKAGFRLWPGCFGQDKCKGEECASVKNSKLIPGAQSEENICLSLIEDESKIREWPDAETYHFPRGWTTEAMATTDGEYRISMRDRDSEEENPGAETHRNKRVRLEDGINRGLPITPGLTDVNYETTQTSCVGKEQACCWMPDNSQPSPKPILGTFCVFGSAVTEKKPCSEPPETNRQMLSELCCEGSKVNTDDDPESFTCQRVRAYIRKIQFSCARTYMPWPFSNSGHTLTANASSTTCPADTSPVKSGTLSSQTNAPTESSLVEPNQTSKQKQRDPGECTLTQRNGKMYGCAFSCSPDTTQAEQSLHCQASDSAGLSTPSQCGSECHTATFSAPSTPVNEPETNSSVATPSPSAIALSDWELTSPFARCVFNSLSATRSSFLLKNGTGVELADAHSTSASPLLPQFMQNPLQKLETFTTSGHFALLSYSDSSQSCESSLILPQEEQEIDGNVFSDGTPSKLQLYFKTSPVNYEHNASIDRCPEANFMILPFLSPISSPQRYSQRSPLSHTQDCAGEEEVNKDPSKYKMLPDHHISPIRDDSPQSCDEDVNHQQNGECCNEEISECTLFTPSSVGDVNNSNEERSQDETNCKEDGDQGSSSSEQDPLGPQVKEILTAAVLAEPQSSLSCDVNDEDFNNEGRPPCAAEASSGLSETAGREDNPAETPGDNQPGVLDEFTAYEQDILLVDMIQDDSELFENLPEQSLLKLGPVRVNKVAKTRPAGLVRMLSEHGASVQLEQRFSPVCVNFHWNTSDVTADEQESRPWRPQSSKTPHVCLATDKETRNMRQPDANNNRISRRSQPIQTVNSSHDNAPLTVRNGSSVTNLAEFMRQKSNAYCRKYFSESLSCGFKMCRFQHVPVDGDEKFCVETVIRFTKNPMCIQKAGAVFTGYYQNNPPGVYFSVPVFLSLLWALLKAGMVSDIFSVLSVGLAHKIVPSYEFLLALFNCVRDKGLTDLMPEILQFTSKVASSGLALSSDGLDSVKNAPELQHTVRPASPASATSEPSLEDISLARSVVEIELCAKQEDWKRMGEVFRSICKFNHPPNQVEQISGRIAVALLSESKDKLSLPFAAFADTVCQGEGDDELIKSFLGRIGVSLMLRYHKTHQWAKGRRVVEVLSMSKVNYSTLKGLFGNEDGASRCCVITKAAELLLLSGSVEAALNTLRENNWFLSSSSWPCEPADLESRTRVLMRLAEKTSHRDTLEVLRHLPGIKESDGAIDISRYSPLFNSHLQVCVDRQMLPVASDIIDLMLSKNLQIDHSLLQIVLHKLGKQKLWLRAREVFRHCLSMGYYQGVSAPTGFMSLMVPCCLGEVELALTFEMLIAVNATAILHLSDSSASSLSITLKRTQSSESEYLSAGSRLLFAACIPQPNLTVQYTTVNASQEQVFTLDICSARRWLRYNHLWANEVWMQ